MVEGAKRMRCGACGKDVFSIFSVGQEMSKDHKVIVECASCKSTTVITTAPSQLVLDWGENSQGVLC